MYTYTFKIGTFIFTQEILKIPSSNYQLNSQYATKKRQ